MYRDTDIEVLARASVKLVVLSRWVFRQILMGHSKNIDLLLVIDGALGCC